MADGSFRRVIQDEEHRREEFLDRQLEVGWEENPADQALEPRDQLTTDRLVEVQQEEMGEPPRLWRHGWPRSGASPAHGARRRPLIASSMARRNRSGS